MNTRAKAIEELEAAGYELARHGKKHDIFSNSKVGCIIPLKRHDFDESDLRYIKNEIKKYARERG